MNIDFNKKYTNTDKFRPAAVFFSKNGYYTNAPKGTTAYKEYWDRERERGVLGYTTDDGEFISGYNYFYLNYCQINLVQEYETKDRHGNIITKAKTTKFFPRFYDYDKYFFDVVEEAERQGKHLAVLKARRKGYSYKLSSMMARNFYLIPGSKSYAYAGEMEFLVKDGILTKAWDYLDFIDEHTAWTKRRQKTDTKLHKRASFISEIGGTPVEMGYKSDIIGVTLKNDVQKIRGKAAKLIVFEEAGKLPDLKAAWQVARPSLEQGSNVHGMMIAFGTGGTTDVDFEGLRDIFNQPNGWNCLGLPESTWDEEAPMDKQCGFFIPDWANLDGGYEGEKFMDIEGNSNRELGLRYSLSQRKNILENASDRSAIDRYIAEHPNIPIEATLDISGNIFPKQDLIKHLAYIRNTKAIREFKQVGKLSYDSTGKLVWEQSKHPKDITKYRLNPEDDPRGEIVIWEHPVDNPPYGLYVAGADPYDHDQSTSGSLGSCIIYKRFQGFESYYDLPVAEYTGRPDTADEFYENVRKLLIYYRATLLYENQNKGLFVYFATKHSEHLLADQPDIINDIIKDSKVQRKKGIHMNEQIKHWGEIRIRDWLNEEYAEGKKNLTKIFSEPLLEELIYYNDKGNFDRCLYPGTKITTTKGFKNIENIDLNDVVLTHKGNFKKVKVKTFDKKEHKIVKLKTVGDYEELLVTHNHPIYIATTTKKKHKYRKESLNNISFINAENLTNKYQFALLPKRKQLNKHNLSDDLLYLLGWYIADGYANIKTNKVEFTLQIDQKHIAEKLVEIINNNIPEKEFSEYKNRKYYSKPAYITKGKGNWYKVNKTSKWLTDFLTFNGGKSNNKLINYTLYNSDNLLPLVIGYLEGDGHQKKFANYDSYRREVIECSTIYEELLKQIRQILIDNGIWSSIRKITKKNIKTQYSISINRKYINIIAENSLKFNKVNLININEKNLQYETDEGFWTPIKIIDSFNYNGFVYNMEIEDDNSYIANNIATHNCMAFMTIMIYLSELNNLVVKEKNDTEKQRRIFDEILNFNKDIPKYLEI